METDSFRNRFLCRSCKKNLISKEALDNHIINCYETRIEKIKEKYNVTFIAIDKLTEGTACTILYARQYIDNELPLLIANSDQIVDIDMNDFINDAKNKSLFGSILTFIDETMNPKWSFVKKNDSGFVEEVKEIKKITKKAFNT